MTNLTHDQIAALEYAAKLAPRAPKSIILVHDGALVDGLFVPAVEGVRVGDGYDELPVGAVLVDTSQDGVHPKFERADGEG